MEHILKNELVYTDGNQLNIYITYNQSLNTYGLLRQSTTGQQKTNTAYSLIHPFENGKAAAQRKEGDFVWLYPDLKEEPMELLDRVIWECLRVRNCTCNCLYEELSADCELCQNGVIFNQFNFRLVDADIGRLRYEYSTPRCIYYIHLTEWERFMDLQLDYLWQRDFLQQEIREVINTFEQQLKKPKELLKICVFDYSEDDPSVKLIPYTLEIEMIRIPKINAIASNRNILGYDDYPYSPN